MLEVTADGEFDVDVGGVPPLSCDVEEPLLARMGPVGRGIEPVRVELLAGMKSVAIMSVRAAQ